ncbi:hypothetical protein D9M68_883260 [compost metagenome]
MLPQRFGGEADPLVGHPVAGSGVQVNASDAGQLDIPAGFFERFAQGCVYETFVGFQVAGRLIKYGAAIGHFFNQQKTPLVLDNGGHGDVGSKAHVELLG